MHTPVNPRGPGNPACVQISDEDCANVDCVKQSKFSCKSNLFALRLGN